MVLPRLVRSCLIDRLERLTGCDQLAPGGDRNSRPAREFELPHPCRCQCGQRRGREHRPGLCDHVSGQTSSPARRMHAPTTGGAPPGRRHAPRSPRSARSIGAVGNRCAGGDSRRCSRCQRDGWIAGCDPGGDRNRPVAELGGAHRVPVHRRSRKGRQRHHRTGRLGQHPTDQAGADRNPLVESAGARSRMISRASEGLSIQ